MQPGHGSEPPVVPQDLNNGAAARAAAAAAAQIERLNTTTSTAAKSRTGSSEVSLPGDSESGIFVDSQDEGEPQKQVPVIRKGMVLSLDFLARIVTIPGRANTGFRFCSAPSSGDLSLDTS